MKRVFFVTGCSSGLGNELVKVVLSRGDAVIATSRNASSLSFEGATKDNFLAVSMDLTSESSIAAAMRQGIQVFGQIDVVVNNAGFGLAGEFESLTRKQTRQQMDINFWAVIEVTRRAMEHMRENGKGGTILQISSSAAQRGIPMFSIYCATKWALSGFTEAVSLEVRPEWKIKFSCIEPGNFRTDWAGPSMDYGTKPSPDPYAHLDARKALSARHGKQEGDPHKGAEAIYKVALMEKPPIRISLGSEAFAHMERKLVQYADSMKEHEELTRSTDGDEEGMFTSA